MTDQPAGRRRSRRRATARQGPPAPAPEPERTAPAPEPDTAPATSPANAPTAPKAERTPPRGENRARRPAAKAARRDGDLVGSGSSQVGPTGAMRARDLNRPSAEDLAEAEAGLAIVRRHWSPAADQPEPRRAPRRKR